MSAFLLVQSISGREFLLRLGPEISESFFGVFQSIFQASDQAEEDLWSLEDLLTETVRKIEAEPFGLIKNCWQWIQQFLLEKHPSGQLRVWSKKAPSYEIKPEMLPWLKACFAIAYPELTASLDAFLRQYEEPERDRIYQSLVKKAERLTHLEQIEVFYTQCSEFPEIRRMLEVKQQTLEGFLLDLLERTSSLQALDNLQETYGDSLIMYRFPEFKTLWNQRISTRTQEIADRVAYLVPRDSEPIVVPKLLFYLINNVWLIALLEASPETVLDTLNLLRSSTGTAKQTYEVWNRRFDLEDLPRLSQHRRQSFPINLDEAIAKIAFARPELFPKDWILNSEQKKLFETLLTSEILKAESEDVLLDLKIRYRDSGLFKNRDWLSRVFHKKTATQSRVDDLIAQRQSLLFWRSAFVLDVEVRFESPVLTKATDDMDDIELVGLKH